MYKITYEDGTIFDGGIPYTSKWNEIEDKPIKKIEYVLGNHKIEMVDYEMYNHMVCYEAIIDGQKMASKVILMGLDGDNVTFIIFNNKKKCIEQQTSKLGREYNNGLTTGWKKGIKGKKCVFSLYEQNC